MFEVPELRVAVTEHRVERYRCACGQVTAGAFPAQVRAPAQYGPRVRALGCYLLVYQQLPVGRAVRQVGEVFGCRWRPGRLPDWLPKARPAWTGSLGRSCPAHPVVRLRGVLTPTGQRSPC